MATLLQKRVWKALEKIPSGRVTTYGEIARYLGTKGVRAVGSAVGKNPNAPIVPCHRVVPSTGKIGNYSASGGVDKKIQLLRSEGVEVRGGKILDFEKRFWGFSSPPYPWATDPLALEICSLLSVQDVSIL